MNKRYVSEYGNDILRRKSKISYFKKNLAQIETNLNRVIRAYDRNLITETEAMKALVNIDLDIYTENFK